MVGQGIVAMQSLEAISSLDFSWLEPLKLLGETCVTIGTFGVALKAPAACQAGTSTLCSGWIDAKRVEPESRQD